MCILKQRLALCQLVLYYIHSWHIYKKKKTGIQYYPLRSSKAKNYPKQNRKEENI